MSDQSGTGDWSGVGSDWPAAPVDDAAATPPADAAAPGDGAAAAPPPEAAAPPAFGWPGGAQPAYGQGASGQAAYGQAAHGQAEYQHGAYGQPSGPDQQPYADPQLASASPYPPAPYPQSPYGSSYPPPYGSSYPPPYPPPPYPQAPYPQAPYLYGQPAPLPLVAEPVAIAGFVTGLISLLVWPLGIVALVLGVVGVVRTARRGTAGRTQATWAMVLGVVTTLVTVVAVVAAVAGARNDRLDALADDCLDGDMVACESLYEQAPVGSQHERIGDTCGYRTDGGVLCTDIDPDADEDGSADGSSDDRTTDDGVAWTYGDDPELDALWEGCEAGDWQACDDLFDESEDGSDYQEYGYTCGHRTDGRYYCEDEFTDA